MMRNCINVTISKLTTLCVIALAIGLSAPANAADSLLITDIGTSARMIGYGNVEGFSDTAESIFENPASLYAVSKSSVSLFTTRFLEDLQYNSVAAAISTPLGTFAAGYFEARINNIALTEVIGGQFTPISFFNYRNQLYKFGYQRSILPFLSIGAAVNYYFVNFGVNDFTGSGHNADVGVLIQAKPFRLSMVGKNLLYRSEMRYKDGSVENLPTQAIAGGAFDWQDLTVMGQTKFQKDKPILNSGGITYRPEFFLNLISFSAGIKEFLVLDRLHNTRTLGVSLHLHKIRFDFAFEKSDHPDYDNKHFFSIGVNL